VTHTYDRANRLLSHAGSSYQYNGLGQRVSQEVSSVVTKYLLDVQPGLWKVLAADDGSNTDRYLHAPTGLHAHEDNAGNWQWMVQDALGSVRVEVDDVNAPQAMQNYTPYGVAFGAQGSFDTPYQYNGEQIDQNGLTYLRARYYESGSGRFVQPDPSRQEQNLYGYSYNDPIDNIDPSGLCWQNANASSKQQAICLDAWEERFGPVSTPDTSYWSNLTYKRFKQEWNKVTPEEIVAAGGVVGVGVAQLDTPLPGPADLAGLALFGACVAIAAVVEATTPTYAPYDFSTAENEFGLTPYEYRLTGFNRKVGTLAEHLAKLLEHDVAGYPPSDPNPYGDPNRGWCNTIKRVIEEIDGAGYSPNQLARDLDRAGFSDSMWHDVLQAVAEVIVRGLCDDHWGDFSGGSLAPG